MCIRDRSKIILYTLGWFSYRFQDTSTYSPVLIVFNFNLTWHNLFRSLQISFSLFHTFFSIGPCQEVFFGVLVGSSDWRSSPRPFNFKMSYKRRIWDIIYGWISSIQRAICCVTGVEIIVTKFVAKKKKINPYVFAIPMYFSP